MFARMTVAQTKTDRFDEAIQVVQETFVPAARDQPGYSGFLLLKDRSQHRLIGISFWDAEAAMQGTSGEGGYYQEKLSDFASMLSSAAITTENEVIVREP